MTIKHIFRKVQCKIKNEAFFYIGSYHPVINKNKKKNSLESLITIVFKVLKYINLSILKTKVIGKNKSSNTIFKKYLCALNQILDS